MPTNPSPPTSRVGFLLIRTSLSSFWSLGPGIVVLLVLGLSSFWSLGPGLVVLWVLGLSSFGSWDCCPFGPGLVVLWVLELSSFRSYGPWVVVVLMVLRMDGCRCVECSVLRGREEGRKEKGGAIGSLYRQISLPTLPTKLRNQGYHHTGYVSFFADRPPVYPPIQALSYSFLS